MNKSYKKQKQKIRSRLNDFKSLPEKEYFKEFCFCLLTPQSKAQRCWQAVQELSKVKNPSLNEILGILKTKTRFHNVKAKRILNSQETFRKIKPLLKIKNILEMRNTLAMEVNGYGLKEASHFVRNIGLSNNKIAILDRHILKHLNVEKIRSPKHYLEIEQIYLDFARKMKIPADELDLLWWSKENGEIFK